MARENPTETISISVPSNLKALLDEFCNRRELNRSQVATIALRKYIAGEVHQWDKALFDRLCTEYLEGSS